MTIPIQNVYYLLCYAWDKLAEEEIVAVDPISSPNLADLFARVLVTGTNHLLRRGFDRGYVPHQEWTGRLRGRICLQEAVRTNGTRTGRLPCAFDELSYNVLHNQILKATMQRLSRVDGIAPESSEGLVQMCRMFADIDNIRLTARIFGLVQLHRNNRFYDFLLKVCELVHRNLLVSEKSGASKFRDFARDPDQMAVLFESFIRNFYRIHTDYRVKREDIHWRWVPLDDAAAALLPKMQTDVSLTSKTRKIIIDCKFTPQATQKNFEAEKLRSSHLYQIYAYLNNLPDGELSQTCEMILLYPTVKNPLSVTYEDKRRKISIRTIDLDQEWPGIQSGLLAIVA